jgi:hypothetical protein
MSAINATTHRSWSDFVDYAADYQQRKNLVDAGPGWYGVNRAADAYKLAREGWRDGMALVQPLAAAMLARPIMEPADDWGWDVTGADYDVGEYLAGTPECWLARVPNETKPTITLMASIACSAGIPESVINAKGAAIVALVQALQSAGHPVRLWATVGYAVQGHMNTIHRALLTDDNGGALDIDRLVFALAHPASNRIISFSACAKAAGQEPSAHMGCLLDPPAELGWECDLYIPRTFLYDAQWKSADAARAWVVEQFNRLTASS